MKTASTFLFSAPRGIALAGLAVLAVVGCAYAPKSVHRSALAAKPPPIVLDYRFGWYHPATGAETVKEIARSYERDATLVARLNRRTPTDRPARGMTLYIPPNNNRDYVRKCLIRINAEPELVPSTPWPPSRSGGGRKTGVKIKAADPKTKTVVASNDDLLESEESSRTAASIAKPLKKIAVSPSTARNSSGGREKRPAPAQTKTVAASVVGTLKNKPARGAGKSHHFGWPLNGEIITRFSEGWQKACHGIEIRAPAKTPVQASRSGKVRLAQEFPGYGKLILIDHMDGYASVYGYLEAMKVREEQWVDRGQQIASIGRPRKGSKPLLFFQVREDGRKVDPMIYLN